MRAAGPIALAGLWLGLGVCPAGADGLLVESDPMRVMSDTPEYCWHLAGEVAAAQRAVLNPSPDVRVLAHEGRRMCRIGLTRGGILRLRRALLLLRGEPQ